jgi:hypothetical protein
MAFSMACFTAMCGLLIAYNGRQVPNLPYGLTFNAVVSILTTAANSALLCVVAASLGQLKWSWFQSQQRKLADVQIFDDASRGPLGAAALLRTTPILSLASGGALVTILTLLMDPFVQQILTYPASQELQNSTVATIPTAYYFSNENESLFTQAVRNGIELDPPELSPSCPSGNCTWPIVTSVGWCSKCEDIKFAVQSSECTVSFKTEGTTVYRAYKNCTVTLPDTEVQINFLTEGRRMNLDPVIRVWHDNYAVQELYRMSENESLPTLNDTTYLQVPNPFLALLFVRFQGTYSGDCLSSSQTPASTTEVEMPFELTHCILDLCLRNYSIAVSNQIPSVQIVGSRFGKTSIVEENNVPAQVCWESRPGIINTAADNHDWATVPFIIESDDFAFCHSAMDKQKLSWGWTSAITSLLAGSISSYNFCLDQNYACDAYLNESSSDILDRVGNVPCQTLMENIGAYLTKLTMDSGGLMVYGTVSGLVSRIRVRWIWLSLPTAVQVAGLVLFLITTISTRRQKVPLWKESLYPLIYHGLDGPGLGDMTTDNRISAMDRTAAMTRARLTNLQTGDRLVLEV